MKLRRFSMTGALCVLVLLLTTWAAAAPIIDAPTRVTQPDGSSLILYSSGDEFFNYIHDQAGNLVMRRADGWYVYAQNENGAPAPTGAVVGGNGDQATLFGVDGMTVGEIDFAAHPELTTELTVGEPQGEEIHLGEVRPVSEEAPAQLFSSDTPTKMANLVVFIRFKGEAEFITLDENGDPIAPIPPDAQIAGLPTTIHFGESYSQVSQYMRRVSNQNFDVVTTFLSADPTRNTITSVEAPRPRSYYESVSGSGMDRFYAEMELLEYALAGVAESLPRDIELDYNNDGKVDNITFIVSGSTGGWQDLLWPHSWALQNNKVTIPNWDGQWKQCFQFNFNFANPRYAGIGVLSHELLHAVGYPDLYRYDYSGDPVGRWDAMGSTDYADPQFLGAYLKSAYTDWGRLGRISTSGTYTLWPLGTEPTADDPTWEGFQIPSGTMGEFICVEYRKNGTPGSVTEDNVPCDGLLVYRANRKAVEGNRNGTLNGGDEVYVFRPGDARPHAGTEAGLSVAALDGVTRTAMGYGLDADVDPAQTLYLDSGDNSGVVIDQVELLEDGRISFRVTMDDDPDPIAPGRYDVDGGDYFISQSGEYIFYGSTSRHHITVAAETTGVSITFEGADMDLSALNRELAPLILRGGSEVTVTFTPAADGSDFTLLAGSQYMPGILVEKGASALLQSDGGQLNAAGGIGAPSVGSDAFQDGGFLHLKNLNAVFTGGGRHTVTSGGVIVYTSYGSSALGGGFRQRMDGILIEDCQLEITGASGVQALSTSYLDLDEGVYVPGGDITIKNSSVVCQGSVDAGDRLTVENSKLSVTLSSQSTYNGALNAVKSLRLLQSHTDLQIYGSNNGMNRNTRDTCAVEVRGGSLRVSTAYDSTIAGSPIAIGSDVTLCLSTGKYEPLAGPWTPEGTATAATIVAPSGDELGVFLQGSFDTPLTQRTVIALTDPDTKARTYMELPSGTQYFVCDLPQTGNYILSDEADSVSNAVAANRQGLNYTNNIILTPLSQLVRRVSISDVPTAITQNGYYSLSGTGTGGVTVGDGLEVVLYLDGVTLSSADGPALTVGANTQARIIAKTGSENLLAGGTGSAAILGQTGSVMAFEGSGMVAALGGQSAPGIHGRGRVTVEPVTTLIALSDQLQALRRAQGDGSLWGSGSGLQPAAVRIILAQPLAEADTLRVFTSKGVYPIPAASGTTSVFLALAAPGQAYLERGDGARTETLACQAGINIFSNVTFLPAPAYDGGVLDLSVKNYLITRNGTYTVTGNTGEHNLRIAPGVTATLRLDSVAVTHFHREDDPAGIIDLGSGAQVTLELLPGSKNYLEVDALNNQTCGIHIPTAARLTIRGGGALTVSGGTYAAAIGCRSTELCGSISIESGQITFSPPYGSSSLTTALGGENALVDISGGALSQTATYGGFMGGAYSRVTIRGGQIKWSGSDHGSIGGTRSNVIISGGHLTLIPDRGGVIVGGTESHVQILGGEIELRSGSENSTLRVVLGGDLARLTLSGGSFTGTVGKMAYSTSGVLGGTDTRATVSGDFQMFLRYLHTQIQPLLNSDLLDFQTEGAFLDVRLRAAMANNETLRLVRSGDGREVSVPLKAGDWGFFLRLEPGAWELYNSSGEFGGSYAVTAGVTLAKDVAFDRLPGVSLTGKTVEYSGSAQYLQVSTLPAGASVRYSGNGQMDPGVYTVTATITTPQGTTYDLTAPLIITKAPLRVTGIRANDKVYDGTTRATGQVLCAGLKGRDVPDFNVSFAFQDANAGTGKTVTATLPTLDLTWANRYDLAPVDPTLLSATAAITPKEARISFLNSDLLQMAGVVQPVTPQFSQYGLSADSIAVTYAADGGAPSATPPQTPGSYTVTATVTDPNFRGSATGTLEVREGFDLRQADAVITAPGSYLITSFGEETSHTIQITDQVATSTNPSVRIYLNNVNIRAPKGKSALDSQMHNMFRTCYTHLYVQGSALNRLEGGEGAPAIQTKDSLELHGEGRLDAIAGPGASTGVEVVQVLYGSGGVVSSYSPSKMYLNGFTGSVWVATTVKSEQPADSSGWLSMDFAQAPSSDTAFTLREGELERDFTLPAGYAYVWHKAPPLTDLRLLDHQGNRLRADSFEYGNLAWTDIPLEAEAPVSMDLNATDAPFVITKSGSYRLYGNALLDKSTLSESPFLTIEGGLEVDLTLDGAQVMIFGTDKPLLSLGRHVDLTLNARGTNELQSLNSSAIWTLTTSGNPTYSHLTLRGEPGSAVEIWGSAAKDGKYTGTDAVVHAGTVDLESGSWHLQAQLANCQGNAWLLRSVNGFTMTGGELTMDVSGTSAYAAGGLYSKGDVLLAGGRVELSPDTRRDYPGIWVYGSHTLTIDGSQVTLVQKGVADSKAIDVSDGTVELRSGSLELNMGALDGKGIHCKDLIAVGGFSLVGVDSSPVDTDGTNVKEDNPNHLVVHSAGGTATCLPGPDGKTPVLLLGQFDKPVASSEYEDIPLTYSDAQGNSVTVIFPFTKSDANKYLNYLLLLPQAGDYTATYVRNGSTHVSTVTVAPDGNTSGGGFTAASRFTGVAMPGKKTVLWDGQSHTMEVEYEGTLPPGTQIEYIYDTADKLPPVEPRDTPYGITARLTAPGYAVFETRGLLTIQKRPLTVQAQAADKPVYDGSTETQGQVILSGAIPGDQLTATATFHFADANVGRNKPVSVTDLQVTGPEGWAEHYSLPDRVTTTASILEKATLSVSWNELTLTQSYGSVDPVLVTLTTGQGEKVELPVTLLYDGSETVPTLPGLYAVTAQLDHINYQASANNSLRIQPRALTFTVLPVPDAAADGPAERLVAADTGFTLAQPGLVPGDQVGVRFQVRYDDLTPGTGRPATVSAVSLTGDHAGRYYVAGYPAAVQVTVHSGGSSDVLYQGTLDGSERSLTWVYTKSHQLHVTGLVSGERVLAARYDPQGQLMGVAFLSAQSPSAVLSADTSQVKLFWLDSGYRPLCPSATVWE